MNCKILTTVNYPNGGAPANYIRNMAQGFADNNFDVEIIFLKAFIKGYNEDNTELKSYKYQRITLKYLSLFKYRPANNLLKIFDDVFCSFLTILEMRKSTKNTVYFIFADKSINILLVYLLYKILNIRLYGVVSDWYDKQNIGKIKRFDSQLKLKYLYRNLSGLIVFSEFLKSKYINYYQPKQIFLQPNLLNLNDFKIEKKIHELKDKIIIGYTGVPTVKDGIEDLIIAFSMVKMKYANTHLLIVGDIVDNGKTLLHKLKKQAVELGILNDITFTGYIPFSNVKEQLEKCDILALTRKKYILSEAGFPTKLGDYFACKIPVVVTKISDIPLYLKDGINAMLAEPDNPQSVAEKIGFLIDNPDKAKVIGENGYMWAKDKLEYKNATKRIINFIENNEKVG